MLPSIFSIEFNVFNWTVKRAEHASSFAPTLRLVALFIAVLLSLSLWAAIIAVLVWMIA